MDNCTIPQKTCTKCGQTYPATLQHFEAQKYGKNGLRAQCRVCRREYKREQDRKYYRANHEKMLEMKRKSNNKQYQISPDKAYIRKLIRRARVRQLPANFTFEQWINCLEYFNYCCAVCGSQLRDLFGNVEPHADHWIPLANPECLGTVAENMICLCSFCNLSKGATMPHMWLKNQYGTRKANEILKRVTEYFEWISNVGD